MELYDKVVQGLTICGGDNACTSTEGKTCPYFLTDQKCWNVLMLNAAQVMQEMHDKIKLYEDRDIKNLYKTGAEYGND